MRLIDADALMQSLGITSMDCDKCAWCDKKWSRCGRGGDFEDACCAIENAPTVDAVEVVRCKDCIHQEKVFHEDKRIKEGGYYICACELADGYSVVCLDGDFCSRGERRTDE